MKAFAMGLLLLLLAGNAQAEFDAHLAARMIDFDYTSDAVASYYGKPVGFMWHRMSYAVPPETSEPVWAVYRFVDKGIECELQVLYYADNSESNLHPVSRVQSFTLITDKPVPIRDGLLILPGSVKLCEKKCSVMRVLPGRELLLFHSRFAGPTQLLSIVVYDNDPSGEPIDGAMKDLNGSATTFTFDMINYSRSLYLPVWGGWDPLKEK
jgi:hypothetical protein